MEGKNQINYKFIPTSLFRGRPDEWATTKQACRDELVVYLFFSSHIYIYLYNSLLTSLFVFSSYIYISLLLSLPFFFFSGLA